MWAPLRSRVAAGGVLARSYGSAQSVAPVRATEEATRQQASRLAPALQAWIATPGLAVSRHAYRSRDAFQRPRGERLDTMKRYLQQGGNLLLVDAHDAAERVAEPVEDRAPNEGTAIKLAGVEAGVDPAGVVVAAEIDPSGVADPPLALDAAPAGAADAATAGDVAASMLAPGVDAVCNLAHRDGVDLLVLRCPHTGFASTDAQSAFLRPLFERAVDLTASGRAHAWTLASPAGLTFGDAEVPAPGALCVDRALEMAHEHGLSSSLAGVHAPLNLAERAILRDVDRSDLDVSVLPRGKEAGPRPGSALQVQALGDVSPLHYLAACGLALFAERPMLSVGPDGRAVRFQIPPHHSDLVRPPLPAHLAGGEREGCSALPPPRALDPPPLSTHVGTCPATVQGLHFRVHGALSQLMGLEDKLRTHSGLADSNWEQRVRDPSSLRWGAILGQNLHQFQTLHEWERAREVQACATRRHAPPPVGPPCAPMRGWCAFLLTAHRLTTLGDSFASCPPSWRRCRAWSARRVRAPSWRSGASTTRP